MNLGTLVVRSLMFRLRSHFGVVLGAAIGTAALVGALVVGDSVRESLHSMALARLGKVEGVLDSNDRFFRSDLAGELQATAPLARGSRIAAVMKLTGVATSANREHRANQVQVLGVDAGFWKMALRDPNFKSPEPDTVILNESLARQLGVKVHSIMVLRVQKPGALSRDAMISPQNDFAVAMRLSVSAIVGDEEFGRFGLQASQVSPFNAYVPLAQLQTAVGQPGRANLLLYAGRADQPTDVNILAANQALEDVWQLEDGELSFGSLTNHSGTELRTSRIFIEPTVAEAVLQTFPKARPILTYMVNELKSAGGSTPYSMVTAASDPFIPGSMKTNEILLSDWAKDDLHVKDGDSVALKYFVMNAGRALEERQADFVVAGAVGMKGIYGDRGLMPDFPGIAQAESSSDWDAGFPINMKKIRPKDEKYWKLYKGTPKAFIPLQTGQLLWSNRFGNVTALRFPPEAGTVEQLTIALRTKITPEIFGEKSASVRDQALNASAQAQDFGGLFIGFSFFLIAAALILMGLLFAFNIEQRVVETGTLLALGFSRGQVRRMYLMEGLGLAVLGSCLGIGGGILYANLMLTGLTSLWSDAVGTSSLQFSAQPESILYGAVGGVAMALIPILWTLARQGRQPVRELLAGNVSAMMGNGSRLKKWFPKLKSHGMWMGPLAALSAVATLFQARSVPDSERADTFFSAGCFCLIAGLALAAVWLTRAGISKRLGLSGLALRGCGRRRSRSLATVGLLSCGVFLIVAIGAFRMDAGDHATTRSSGTGGFALMAESSFPVTHDLNSQSGLDFFNLNARLMEGVHVVPFRVHAGDEASCLNLNRAQKPRLLGVNPAWLTEHACFTFAEWDKDFATNQTSPKSWDILKSNSAGNATSSTNPIPAIADQNSIVWAMGKKLGDTLDYTDARGKTFQVRLVGALANSVLQGNLIISETEFLKHFPDESGYRIFLIDAPATNATAVAAEFTRAMSDTGIEVRSAVQRLDEFNAVQNTYLNTFQVLGGLGMLIGSAGLGVVVLRNVQDRRSELALLLAVGFQRGEVESLVLREHAALLLAGLVIGTVSALIAVLPSLNSISQFPFISLGLTLMVVLMSGLLSTWLASRLALRGRLVDSLRSD